MDAEGIFQERNRQKAWGGTVTWSFPSDTVWKEIPAGLGVQFGVLFSSALSSFLSPISFSSPISCLSYSLPCFCKPGLQNPPKNEQQGTHLLLSYRS